MINPFGRTMAVHRLKGSYMIAEDHHIEMADLFKRCMDDWKDDPIIHAQLEAQYEKELAAAKAYAGLIFNITKNMV